MSVKILKEEAGALDNRNWLFTKDEKHTATDGHEYTRSVDYNVNLKSRDPIRFNITRRYYMDQPYYMASATPDNVVQILRDKFKIDFSVPLNSRQLKSLTRFIDSNINGYDDVDQAVANIKMLHKDFATKFKAAFKSSNRTISVSSKSSSTLYLGLPRPGYERLLCYTDWDKYSYHYDTKSCVLEIACALDTRGDSEIENIPERVSLSQDIDRFVGNYFGNMKVNYTRKRLYNHSDDVHKYADLFECTLEVSCDEIEKYLNRR